MERELATLYVEPDCGHTLRCRCRDRDAHAVPSTEGHLDRAGREALDGRERRRARLASPRVMRESQPFVAVMTLGVAGLGSHLASATLKQCRREFFGATERSGWLRKCL